MAGKAPVDFGNSQNAVIASDGINLIIAQPSQTREAAAQKTQIFRSSATSGAAEEFDRNTGLQAALAYWREHNSMFSNTGILQSASPLHSAESKATPAFNTSDFSKGFWGGNTLASGSPASDKTPSGNARTEEASADTQAQKSDPAAYRQELEQRLAATVMRDMTAIRGDREHVGWDWKILRDIKSGATTQQLENDLAAYTRISNAEAGLKTHELPHQVPAQTGFPLAEHSAGHHHQR